MAKHTRPLNAGVMTSLKAKAKNSRFTVGELQSVYRRGQGAFLSSGSRPGQTMGSWAMARVNSFLRGSKKHDLDIRAKALKRRRG